MRAKAEIGFFVLFLFSFFPLFFILALRRFWSEFDLSFSLRRPHVLLLWNHRSVKAICMLLLKQWICKTSCEFNVSPQFFALMEYKIRPTFLHQCSSKSYSVYCKYLTLPLWQYQGLSFYRYTLSTSVSINSWHY